MEWDPGNLGSTLLVLDADKLAIKREFNVM